VRGPQVEALNITETFPGILLQKEGKAANRIFPFRKWALRVPEPKSGTLDFERFPFQKQLYTAHGADAAELVIMKSTQVGVSAYLLRWAMYHADLAGLTALYVFPKRQQMYDFADARIRAAILGSDYLTQRIPGGYVNNKGLKQVGLGWLYARGSESKADLDSVDADALVFDEYDSLRQENIPDAERRITGSLEGRIRRVGVPSIPGWGIDELYHEGDQRSWFVRCECGERQRLTYDDNVDEEAAKVVCAKCRRPLDVGRGEWVAAHPDREIRSYHIPRLIVPNTNMRTIITAHHRTNPYERQVHFNKDLGEAYAPSEGRLALDVIRAAQRDDIPLRGKPLKGGSPDIVTAGIDVASVRSLHVRISAVGENHKRALWIGEAEDFDAVEKLLNRFKVNMAAVDHLPEGRLARKLAEALPGRVFLVSFGTETQRQVITVDADARMTRVRRTEALDATLDGIREQRNLLPGELPHDYEKHLQSPIRVVEKNPDTGAHRVVYRSTGADDYAMAECYDLVAKELWLWRQATDDALREEMEPLDDVVDFERAHLDGDDGDAEIEYQAGLEQHQ
jgi:hypothetical protein